MAESKRPSEIRLQDPLSDVTRAERKTLLGLSAVGLVIARSGLVPSRISALGIEFDRADQSALLGMLAAVVVYFLVAFVVYATSDFVAWRVAFRNAVLSSQREYEAQSDDQRAAEDRLRQRLRSGHWWAGASRSVSVTRALFEFLVPLIIGVFAVYSLSVSRPPTTTTSSNQVKPAPITEQPNKPLQPTSGDGR
jgi:hypothetical protein